MTGNDKFNFTQNADAGQTVDLQGVASFASLVEILATELGTTPGKIQGLLPNGPSNFDQLVGEISVNSQGFVRTVNLFTAPGQPLKMRITTSWRDAIANERAGISGIESQIILGASVDKIAPQARALARHLEELFSVLDRMATLGQSARLSAMSISESELAKFEQQEAANLVKSHTPRTENMR
ncbi:MAG: hypothetical protein K2X81_07105 [Candidatus Obscuribacterales bacterium]|nr:hypothetical protein [Candidatus Obscuribacterales bacterium]